MGSTAITAKISLTSGNIVLSSFTYGTVTYTNVNLKMTPGTYQATLNSSGNTAQSFTIDSVPYTVTSSTGTAPPLGTLGLRVQLIKSGTAYAPTSFSLNIISTTGGIVGTGVTIASGNMVFPTFTFVDSTNKTAYQINATPSGGINVTTV